MEDLDALLDDAGKPGEATFTLDPRRAREQLARHALPDPYTYVLKLVQWAVTAGARSIDVRLEGNRLEFRHDGVPPEPLGAEAHLHKGNFDLALALATLERLNARAAYGEGLLIEGVPQSGRLAGLLNLQIGAGWWQRLKTWLRPEAALLRMRCVHCPALLTLNGELVNRPWSGIVPSRVTRISDGWQVWPDRRHALEEIRALGTGPLHRPLTIPFTGREDDGCEAFVTRMPAYESKHGRSSLTWVRHGVILGAEHGSLPNFAIGVASADDLTVDLSQFSLVRDARYEALVQRLNALALAP